MCIEYARLDHSSVAIVAFWMSLDEAFSLLLNCAYIQESLEEEEEEHFEAETDTVIKLGVQNHVHTYLLATCSSNWRFEY